MSEVDNLSWLRAKEMREAGSGYRDISRETGIPETTLKRRLDPDNYATVSNGMDPMNDGTFIERHKPRVVRQILDRRILNDAVKAFAKGDLLREELMELVTL